MTKVTEWSFMTPLFMFTIPTRFHLSMTDILICFKSVPPKLYATVGWFRRNVLPETPPASEIYQAFIYAVKYIKH